MLRRSVTKRDLTDSSWISLGAAGEGSHEGDGLFAGDSLLHVQVRQIPVGVCPIPEDLQASVRGKLIAPSDVAELVASDPTPWSFVLESALITSAIIDVNEDSATMR